MLRKLLVVVLSLSCVPARAWEQEGLIQYKMVEKGRALCDTGILYTGTPGALEVEVSALATGKGSDLRKWEVTDIKLDLGGKRIRPVSSEKFHVSQESYFRLPAAVVFAAIGSQYEMYADDAASGMPVPVGGDVQGRRSDLDRGIDKAGMAAGMGLLAAQASGEITGLVCVFILDPPAEAALSGGRVSVRVVVENEEAHDRERIVIDMPPAPGGKGAGGQR